MYKKFCEKDGYPLARGNVCPKCATPYYGRDDTQGLILRRGELTSRHTSRHNRKESYSRTGSRY
jgi:hypothetical protein